MCRNEPVPPKVPQPFDCYLAKGFRHLVRRAGLDPSSLPLNLASRLKDPDAIPERIWSHFAQSGRIDQAQAIYWLYQFTQFKWISHAEFNPNSLLSYLPVELLGISPLQLFVQFMDTEGYFKQLGLDGGRTIFNGQIRYPYVEDVFHEERQRLVSIHGLRDETRLIEFIQTIGQRYEYPSVATQTLANLGIAYWLADQVENLNPGLITTRPELGYEVD